MQVRAAVTRDRGAEGLRTAVLGTVGAALVLAAYGLVRYPGLRSGAGVWGACGFLILLLICYAAAALTLSRGTTRQARAARRFGAAGGLVVGAAWFASLAPPHMLKPWVFVPLLVALVVPACVAGLAGRADRDAATAAAIWSGLVGGLLVFVIWVAGTYARNGRPYDPQMLRDFHRAGGHDLAAYAVSDNLGAAIGLLAIIPVVALAAGSLVARAAARPGRREPA
jgi:hypothetical protein